VDATLKARRKATGMLAGWRTSQASFVNGLVTSACSVPGAAPSPGLSLKIVLSLIPAVMTTADLAFRAL